MLDSKRAFDAPIIAGAPRISEFYSDDARAHHEAVLGGLDILGIPYVEESRLVRGLDYYRRTTFEYAGGTLESAQNALGGGGRYDGLVEDLGGKPTPGVGFALGLDRILIACDDEGCFAAPSLDVDVFVIDTTGGAQALAITDRLRSHGMTADRAYENRSMKSQMKVADRSGATVAVIIGSDELAAGTAVVRTLRVEPREQVTVPLGDLHDTIRKFL